MSRAIPKVLIDEVGLDTLISRLPPAYAHSIFASFVSSRFIYQYGLDNSPVDFHYFVAGLTKQN